MATLYEILNVNVDADAETIRSSYRKLCLIHHPDKAAGRGVSEQESLVMFQKVQDAYETLSDPEKREMYDLSLPGRRSRKPSHPSSGHHRREYHNQTFVAPRPAKHPPKTSTHTIDVTIEELFFGVEKRLIITRKRPCKYCDGYGFPVQAYAKRCWKCGGDGRIPVAQMTSSFFMAPMFQTCPTCEGSKYTISEVCSVCNGDKVYQERVVLPIRIAPGTRPDEKISYDKASDQMGDWVVPGDILLQFNVLPHRTMAIGRNRATGLQTDLCTTISLTFTESFMGFDRVILRHLDGQHLRYMSPRPDRPGWHFFRQGEVFRIAGQGLCLNRANIDTSSCGDIVITVAVEDPPQSWALSLVQKDVENLESLLPPKRQDVESSDVEIYVRLEPCT